MKAKLRSASYISFLVIFALLLVNSAYCSTAQINASQDSSITIYEPYANYGSETSLYINSFLDHQQRSLVQFDLSSIPSGATISSATLKLYYGSHYGGSEAAPAGRTYWAYRVTHSWTESGVTWDSYDGTNPWTTAGSDYTVTDGASLTMPSSLPVWVQWDVTDIVSAWIEDGQPNYGFLIRDADETQNMETFNALFRSREYTNIADLNPTLEIVYTGQAEPTIESCDASGNAKTQFAPNEDVYVKGINFPTSSTSYLYIFEDGYAWNDGVSIPAGFLEGPVDNFAINSDASGNIAPTLVWSSPLTQGSYDIIVDVPTSNGLYDEGVDAINDIEIDKGAFFVVPEVAGSIMAASAMFAALGLFVYKKKHTTTQ